MPRKSKHKICYQCEKPAQVVANTSFYVLKPKSQVHTERKQVKGTVLGHGYCFEHFLEKARKQGCSKADMQKLQCTLNRAK